VSMYRLLINSETMTPTNTPSLEHLVAMLHELEANLECLAERLNRLEHAPNE
jgi:hypothetical protein